MNNAKRQTEHQGLWLLLAAVVAVFVLQKLISNHAEYMEKQKQEYRENCEQTGSTVAWNGRNYECLKQNKQ